MDTKPSKIRRRFSDSYRRQVVQETLTGTESVSAVARRHDVNANLVFKWRERYRHENQSGSGTSAAVIPVRLTASTAHAMADLPGQPGAHQTGNSPPCPAGPDNHLDIELASGHHLRLRGSVTPALMGALLKALR